MKVLITERFKFLISWLKKEGYFKTNKELGALVGITNESTLSTAINGTRPNHSFVERVCELDARINIQWLYNANINSMFYNEQTSLGDVNNFADNKQSMPKEDKELATLAKLVNSLQDTVATQKALINIYEAEIKRLQRAVQFKESGKRAASALPDSEEF